MKTLTFSNGIEMACNNDGAGIFCRRSDGTWGQWVGTCQAYGFNRPTQLSRYLHRRYDMFDGTRVIEKSGWTV